MKDKELNVTKDQEKKIIENEKKIIENEKKLHERKMYRHMNIDELIYNCIIL